MNHPDEETFDDLHQGVFALRGMAENESVPLSTRAKETLQRLETVLPATKNKVREMSLQVKRQAVIAAKKTDQAAHDHPWKFTLGALGMGVLAGLLISGLTGDSED